MMVRNNTEYDSEIITEYSTVIISEVSTFITIKGYQYINRYPFIPRV